MILFLLTFRDILVIGIAAYAFYRAISQAIVQAVLDAKKELNNRKK